MLHTMSPSEKQFPNQPKTVKLMSTLPSEPCCGGQFPTDCCSASNCWISSRSPLRLVTDKVAKASPHKLNASASPISQRFWFWCCCPFTGAGNRADKLSVVGDGLDTYGLSTAVEVLAVVTILVALDDKGDVVFAVVELVVALAVEATQLLWRVSLAPTHVPVHLLQVANEVNRANAGDSGLLPHAQQQSLISTSPLPAAGVGAGLASTQKVFPKTAGVCPPSIEQ